jgi:hypothetical protein
MHLFAVRYLLAELSDDLRRHIRSIDCRCYYLTIPNVFRYASYEFRVIIEITDYSDTVPRPSHCNIELSSYCFNTLKIAGKQVLLHFVCWVNEDRVKSQAFRSAKIEIRKAGIVISHYLRMIIVAVMSDVSGFNSKHAPVSDAYSPAAFADAWFT